MSPKRKIKTCGKYDGNKNSDYQAEVKNLSARGGLFQESIKLFTLERNMDYFHDEGTAIPRDGGIVKDQSLTEDSGK